MRQPVLVIMNVPENTHRDTLGKTIEGELRDLGHDVEWAIPMDYTLDVPEGAITG